MPSQAKRGFDLFLVLLCLHFAQPCFDFNGLRAKVSNDRITGIASLRSQRRRWAASPRAFFVKRSLWVGLEIIQPYGGGSLPPLRHSQAHSAAGPRPSRTWVMTATAQNPSSRAFFAKRSPWLFSSGICNMFQLPRLLRCARKDVSGKASSRASVAK